MAAGIFLELAGQADLVLAGRRAIGMMLGTAFDDADGNVGFAEACSALFKVSPHTRFVAATRRRVISAANHELTGLLADRQGTSTSRTIDLDGIVDRIGTGDAFAAGILHGLTTGMDRQKTVDFAVAASEWAHSVPGDFLRAKIEDIVSLQTGLIDVKR